MYALTDFSNAEKIATIIASRSGGAFGKYVPVGNGWTRVELLDDAGKTTMCVLVKSDRIGWTVSFCGVEFTDADLEIAAGMAADWQKSMVGKAIATRNVKIYGHGPLNQKKKGRRQTKKS